MEPTVREAKPEDCAAVTRLNREEMGYDYPVKETEQKLKKLLADPANGSRRGAPCFRRFPHGRARVLSRVRL